MHGSVKHDEFVVALVSAACLMALVVTLKNVLHVSATQLSQDIVIYASFYSVFWLWPLISAKTGRKSKFDSSLVLSLVAVAVTAGIIAVYAV